MSWPGLLVLAAGVGASCGLVVLAFTEAVSCR